MLSVSVVMPVFNAERYVGEAVASVLAQSYAALELVVVDDGSSDSTRQIVAAFDDRRIRLLVNDRNRGVTFSANRAMGEAAGQFIARMDADDICAPDRIAAQVAYLEAHPGVEILGGAIEYFGESTQRQTILFPADSADIHAQMLFYCPLAQPALMFRRRLSDEGLLRYDDEYPLAAEDYHLWSRLLGQGVRAANLPDIVLRYRIHTAQASAVHQRVQYEASRRVRHAMLDAAGVLPASAEMDFHEAIVTASHSGGWAYLNRVAAWFERVIEANRASHYWDEVALRAVFARKCHEVGLHLALLHRPSQISLPLAAYLAQSGYRGDDPVRYGLRHARRAIRKYLGH